MRDQLHIKGHQWLSYVGKRDTYLILTIYFKVFFGSKSIRIWMLWGCLDTFCNVSEDLLCSQHAIRIKSRVPKNK